MLVEREGEPVTPRSSDVSSSNGSSLALTPCAHRGCSSKIRADRWQEHVDFHCAYRPTLCNRCFVVYPVIEQGKVCPYHTCHPSPSLNRSRLIRCAYFNNCSSRMKSDRWAEHVSSRCIHRPILCRICGEKTTTHEIKTKAHRCKKRKKCRYCDEVVMSENMSHHNEFECSQRTVTCSYCAKDFAYCALESHRCMIVCLFGCGRSFDREHFDSHAEMCDVFRPKVCVRCGIIENGVNQHVCIAPCILLCDEVIYEHDLQSHAENMCVNRKVQCNGCGAKVKEILLERHDCDKIPCPHCSLDFKAEDYLFHVSACAKLKCPTCPLVFPDVNEKRSHMPSCSNIKCDDCNLIFPRSLFTHHQCHPAAGGSKKRVKLSKNLD